MFELLPCFGLLLVCLIVPAGHAIWLVLAAAFGTSSRQPREWRQQWRRCPRCGTRFPDDSECPDCGLDPHSEMARELRDLEAARRAVVSLDRAGGLNHGVCEEVRHAIEARQIILLTVDRPKPHAGQPPVVEPVPALPMPALPMPLEPALEPGREPDVSLLPRRAAPTLTLALDRSEEAKGAPSHPGAPASPESSPVAIETPPTPRRSLSEWLSVFMEERNVLWGEVIGGMLIVGCSIALVISLWRALETIPYSPFLILATLTSGLIGSGFYTLHRWKLESTSRGLLMIGMLLVPLDFLVLAGLSGDEGSGVLELVTAGAGLAWFGWLARKCGRVLIGEPLESAGQHAGTLLMSTVLASALALLLIPYFATGDAGPGQRLLLGLLPTAAQAAALGIVLVRIDREPRWTARSLRGLFALISLSAFACVAALGFLAYTGHGSAGLVRQLALPAAAFGLPLLIGGSLIYRRLASESAEPAFDGMGLGRTAGTVTALVGIAVLFGAFAMALDNAPLRWIVGILNVAALAASAWALRLPLLHVPAQVYLLLLCHADWQTAVDWRDVRPELAVQLAVLMVLQIGVSELCSAWARRRDGLYYLAGAGAATALAALWAITFSDDHPRTAASVLGVAAASWLITNRRWRISLVTYGTAVCLLGSVRFAAGVWLAEYPAGSVWLRSLLAHATMAVGLAAAFGRWSILRSAYTLPLRVAALSTSTAATILLLATLGGVGLASTAIA
jgi:hypothetical protein